jgi:folate-binding protein YgfZ
MDNVQVRDASPESAQFEIVGELAGAKLQEAGMDALPKPGQILPARVGGVACRILAWQGSAGVVYRLVAPAAEAPALERWLDASGIAALTLQAYELYRIEAGLPGEKNELTEAYTPLETNLEQLVAPDKGCYTGQEILARQITYDKVTRKLAGLRLSATAQSGDPVLSEGRPAGQITSAILSPRLGPIALAVLKRPCFEPGTEVEVETSQGKIRATVTGLPFA